MEDSQILELFFCRDEAAVRCADQKYGAALFSISLNITDNSRDSEECLNDTFLQAWNNIPPQRPLHLLSWLASIIRNLSINRYHLNRAQKRNARLVELTKELEECVGTEADLAEDMILKECLNGFLAGLDRETRYIFVRRYYYADSLRQISDVVGRSENNLASLLLRARKKLRRRLEKEGIFL